MKQFIVCFVIIFSGLLIHDRDRVYSISGHQNKFFDGRRNGEYEGEVFEDKDRDLRGYVQEERYSRKIPVKGEWDGQGRMKLKDDYGNEYEMDVDDEGY